MSSNNHTPDQDSPETATAVAEPSADAGPDQRSFAERVGKRKPVSTADPFEIAVDAAAGVRFFESSRDRQVAIKFGEGRPEDKPSQAVIDRMKEAGYRWNPADRIWAFPVLTESAMSTRIEAKRLYNDVCQMIRQEKSIDTQPDLPF